jgi:ferric-dicitrate binding protein FerR (iron transport regulator)
VTDDPGVVFSVKELIGRLDGKLDMVLNVLTNKADRADVNALDRRMGDVEDKVNAISQHNQDREEAARLLEKKEKERKDEEERRAQKRRERRQFIIGTAIAVVIAAAAVLTLLIQGSSGK